MKAKAIISAGIVFGLLATTAPLHARIQNGSQGDEQQGSQNQNSSTYNGNNYNANNPPTSEATGPSGNSQNQNQGAFGPPPSEPPPPVDRASHVIGMKVKNGQYQNLGTVTDVVFDIQNGRISYLVVRKEGRHGSGDYVAIPPSAFSTTRDMRNLTLNTDKRQFENSQGFSRNNYPPMGEPAFGAQPNTQQQEIIIVPVVPQNQDQNQPNTPEENNNNQNQNQDQNQNQQTPRQSSPNQSSPTPQ